MIDRTIYIYQRAIEGSGIDEINPTEEEIKDYNEIRAEILEKTEQAKREGRVIIWDIPFDP